MTAHSPILGDLTESRFIDIVRTATMAEQMSILSWILNGVYVRQSDDFVDALTPTQQAFEEAWDRLSAIAEPQETLSTEQVVRVLGRAA